MIASEAAASECCIGIRGRLRPLAARKRLRCLSSRDLVECRIRYIGGSYGRRSFDNSRQGFHDLRITGAVVSFRICLGFPEAVTNGFSEIRRDKGDFIQEPLLLAQHWDYFLLNQAGKFRGTLRFEFNYYMACKHIMLLWF